MGRQAIFLCKHTLPFGDEKSFLTALAQRFQRNVCSYFVSYLQLDEHFPEKMEPPNSDDEHLTHYVIDKCVVDPNAPWMYLLKEDYQYRFLYEKFGEKASEHAEMEKVAWSNDPKENQAFLKAFANDSIQYNLEIDAFSICMYKESCSISLDQDFDDWWSLFRLLVEGDHTHLNFFLETCAKKTALAKTLGAHSAYVLDTQGKTAAGMGEGNAINATWQEIESALNTGISGQNQINLHQILMNPAYLERVQKTVGDKYHDFSLFLDDFGAVGGGFEIGYKK